MGLELVELIMGIEDEFGIEIPDRAAGELRTVSSLGKCVFRQLAEGTGPDRGLTESEVIERVRLIVARYLDVPVDHITESTDFARDLYL